jgi:hypothetical protein
LAAGEESKQLRRWAVGHGEVVFVSRKWRRLPTARICSYSLCFETCAANLRHRRRRRSVVESTFYCIYVTVLYCTVSCDQLREKRAARLYSRPRRVCAAITVLRSTPVQPSTGPHSSPSHLPRHTLHGTETWLQLIWLNIPIILPENRTTCNLHCALGQGYTGRQTLDCTNSRPHR